MEAEASAAEGLQKAAVAAEAGARLGEMEARAAALKAAKK